MDEANSTLTFASNNKWVCWVFLGTPTNSALNIIFCAFRTKVFETSDLLGLLELLVIKLFLTHRYLIAFEIFYSKSDTTKFDSIKFLNLVIIFSSFIFKRSSYEPKSINTFLLLVGSSSSVIKIVALCVFLEQAQTTSIRTLSRVYNVVWLIEINLIIVPYYLTLRLRFQTHLDDVSGLIVEQTVRVS